MRPFQFKGPSAHAPAFWGRFFWPLADSNQATVVGKENPPVRAGWSQELNRKPWRLNPKSPVEISNHGWREKFTLTQAHHHNRFSGRNGEFCEGVQLALFVS